MNLQQVEKANKIITFLKELDKEIIKIEQLAQQLANNDCKIEIKVEDFTKKVEKKPR